MADRNPYIPSERRQEMEERTQANKEEANQRFGKEQANLEEEVSQSAVHQEGTHKPRAAQQKKKKTV